MTTPNPSPAASAGLTRAQLYERIRTSSKEEVVLSEMQRLGFWPADSDKPTLEAAMIRREGELTKALQELGRELQAIQDPVAALKAMRKERMAKARARREETRQKRARERHERAAAWHQRRQRELLYLGAGVSAGLNHTQSDSAKLTALNLPLLHSAQDLAQAMGLALPELRFLAFERRVSRISHYRRFAMPKKTGGERIISAPMPRLKRAQYWVLDNLLNKAVLHPATHGFVAGRSILSNALPHVGQAVVINLDLKDFFPSIRLPRIKGIFRQLGYGEQVATTLALLCTEAPTEEVSVDGERFFVAHGPRALPQGAPSSPALTNILCRRLDARLQACAAKLGFRYTRYADDLTFSGDAAARKLAGKLLWRARQIVIDEGFTPHPQKQHVMRSAQRQQVTGIVVNRQPALERDTLRRFRATLYQVEKDGPQGKHWNGNPNVLAALEGYAQFIRMVDAAKGLPLLQRVRAARAKWQDKEVPQAAGQAKHQSDFRTLSAQGKAPWEGWWQPAVAPAPVLEKTAEQVVQEKREVKALHKAPREGKPLPAPRAEPEMREAQGGLPAIPWGPLLGQFVIAFLLARSMRNLALLVVGCAVIGLAAQARRANWPLFALAMAVALVVGLMF